MIAVRHGVVAVVVAGVMLAAAPSRAGAVTASCYGQGLFGNEVASSTPSRPVRLWPHTVGVAHKTLPFGTRLRARVGGSTITVEVIDRGPYEPGRQLDFTQAAAQRLGFRDCDTFGVRAARTWRAR